MGMNHVGLGDTVNYSFKAWRLLPEAIHSKSHAIRNINLIAAVHYCDIAIILITAHT